MKRPFVLGLATLTALTVLPFVPAAPATAAFPGRNARIVFMRFGVVNNLGEIHSMTATGGGLLNLTNTPLIEDRDPAWSPDGERIAFRRFNAGPDQLWVMNADGTGLTVVPGSGAARYPAWSPDGKRLVYECYESQPPYARHICLREVTGGGFTLLSAAPGADDTHPSWSPDGTRIVWTRRFAGGSHLVVLTLKSLSLDPLTPPVVGDYDSYPDWSPDSKQVVFSRNPSGVSGASIYRIAANGKSAVQLVVGPPSVFDSHYTMPVWSPDGKQIAYVHIDDDESWGNIYTITPDGKDNTQLTFGAATDQNIDWGVA